jgi:nucleotidyltransferase/DNA polymerase involved in DNA repair
LFSSLNFLIADNPKSPILIFLSFVKKKFELFQQYSIDECFVEYTEEMQETYGDPVKVANEIREYIKKKC